MENQSQILTPATPNKRSGEIDFFRFLFSVIIVILHFEDNYDFGYFKQASVMVEFFFLVSGYLMAQHVERMQSRPRAWGEIADSTWKFMLKKIGSFYRYYFCAVILNFVMFQIVLRYSGITSLLQQLLRSIPTFTLTFMGLNYQNISMYVGNTWYLSAMIIAMFVLYPLLLRQFRLATKILFPLISMFLLGYLYNTFGGITSWAKWDVFCYTGILRAVAEIALGASLFQLSKSFQQQYRQWVYAERTAAKLLITLIKFTFYLAFIAYAYGLSMGKNPTLHAMLLCAAGVALSFAGVGYSIPDNKLTRWLGKISLPIFIFHGSIRHICKRITGEAVVSLKMSMALIIMSILLSILLMYVTDFVWNRTKRLFAKQ